jgi:Ni/Co efflux regulator RcnB
MKKIILATVAFSLIATPAAFAQSYHPQNQHDNFKKSDPRNGHGNGKDSHQQRRWSKGQRLDQSYRRNYIQSRDYGRYRLRQPPRGYQWVRVDNDFILVSVATGLISSIIGAAMSH